MLAGLYFWSYQDSLRCFFHFDDFWVLAAAARIHLETPLDLWQFFRPVHGFLLYRPVSTVFYFFALHQFFGYDPTGYHAVQLAFHVINALLVYAIADTLFLSRPLGLATALVYATAPGHAIAVYWNALFTITGTAFFYFVGLWVWLRLHSRWRMPITFVLFVAALLASEHAVSFPIALTLAAVLLPGAPTWRRLLREQAPFYLVVLCYLGAKLAYLRYGLTRDFPDPAVRAYIALGYHTSVAPVSILRQLGHYFTFAVDAAYGTGSFEVCALGFGIALMVVAMLSTGLVLTRRWVTRPLRVAAFGLDLFVVALAPVLVLPSHVFSYYVGIAALGLALALMGCASALPRFGHRLGPCVVVLALVATHVAFTARAVRRSEEFRFFDAFSTTAARWLYTLSQTANHGAVEEVVVPANGLTDLVFGHVQAQALFLCAHYVVRTVPDVDQVGMTPKRLVIPAPWALPTTSPRWGWLARGCAEGYSSVQPVVP